LAQVKRPAGSFGARPCRTLRAALLAGDWTVLPPSWQRKWMVQRIIATPPWADFTEIRAVYVRARLLSEQTGVVHNVDHIIPLHHPRVSGLHVHFNLRAIPAGPNMSKGNHWCPEQLEMFDGPEQLRLL
jgi:hypothetical protein